jgi:hypothetical protein
MVLFLVGMLFHIYLNWNALFSYLKNKSREFSLLNKEFLLALALNLLFLIGTLFYWVPFERLFDFQDRLKSSWEKPQASSNPKNNTHESGKQKLKLQP